MFFQGEWSRKYCFIPHSDYTINNGADAILYSKLAAVVSLFCPSIPHSTSTSLNVEDHECLYPSPAPVLSLALTSLPRRRS